MDKRYEAFCLADEYFYETPDRLSGGAGASVALFSVARRDTPDGWVDAWSGDWRQLQPLADRDWPEQGWKVHVSARLDNADRIGTRIWDYCVPRSIPFKFVPGKQLLYLRNSKYASRTISGKFATIYPRDDAMLHTLLRELGGQLGAEDGPYILTDLRWQDGPLHVRYGGFAPRYCVGADGTLVPAVEGPDGTLVPDRKDPAFSVPDWVTLPGFLAPELAARNATTTTGLPYRIERALHFSNGGGVYAGTDLRDGAQVVLKEARPHAGLAADGADAVARLERERAALERLAGLGVAPGVRDWFELGGHRFLVMDFLPGRTLNSFFAERHPLLAARPDPAEVASYTRWAVRVHGAVERAVAAVHGRGLGFNDLHMFNIMVAPEADAAAGEADAGAAGAAEVSVALVDFEAAAPVADGPRQIVAHPGYVAPADREGFAIDRYALACLRIALFLPMTTLLAVDRRKAAHLARVAAEQFPELPEEFLREAVEEITGGTGAGARTGKAGAGGADGTAAPAPDSAAVPAARPGAAAGGGPLLPVEPDDWPSSRAAMARALAASATPERDDRVFPGDVAQFDDGGGLGISFGAAGVLYALAEAGAPRSETGEEWLLKRTAAPPRGTPFGLYDGLLGVAYVLERLGHGKRALDLVEQVLAENWQALASHLHGGLAGAGLVLGHLATACGEPSLHDHALRAATLLTDRLAAAGPAYDGGAARTPAARGGERAGLLRGWTGPALFFVRLYERTGDPALLDAAATALRRDLDRCRTDRTGGLVVDEGHRTMPYLGDGSAGIATVLDDYLGHRDDEDFAAARAAVLPAVRMRYYAQPGLFQGRAGMLLHLGRTATPGVRAADLGAQAAALSWYALPYGGGLAFPGDQMMRLSMDLATGTAGCLLALAAAQPGSDAGLPFLSPAHRRGRRADRPHDGAGVPAPSGKSRQ
ncbi:class III lanthionine synthetase LanKC [Streptomyces sp. CMB-StM0423]|uniref:class III lanthionine synthetase LanKC n=1 Tax=Streptomyces sp. CMB-StM0423 TaxID=2059884 RepID=UPI000C70EC77|nr:class III lanthionine synthetase LanKC [Streptomyces sp. CMB-StM0423]AUH39719.1 lantipeptide synthetase [Streptomyces sp. CMB-StM0423]